MEFGVNLDQTAADLLHEMTWNFHEKPCHIFYRGYNYFDGNDEPIKYDLVFLFRHPHFKFRGEMSPSLRVILWTGGGCWGLQRRRVPDLCPWEM